MTSKAKLQTLGTVSSLVLAFISTHLIKTLIGTEASLSPIFLVKYSLFAIPLLLLVLTGVSYMNSIDENNNRFLYYFVSLAHFFAAIIFMFAQFKFVFL